ncbi:MAG: DUF1800 family protein, partial [Gemmataceae bacterium]|nr:DUF1800 family protein [Gemmataceae bacterium]
LFSMGEGQGYTEQDVREGARALTGYTFDPKTLQPRFLPKSHDPDEKTILGKKGKWNGEQFVDLILAHPATSRFIAMRLFKYFAHEEPDAALINRLAKVLRDNNYEVAPLLRTIFLSREFYSPRATATHYKSPAQLVVGTARILGAKTYDGGALALAMRNMGQDLFDPPNVKGWEGGETWINSVTIFARQNFTSALVGQGIGKGAIKAKAPKKLKKATGPLVRDLDLIAPLERRNLTTPAQVVDYYTKALLLAPLDEQRRAQLLRLVGDLPAPSQWAERRQEINQRLGALIILITSLPEYQLA